jgi:DNA polymerase-3 subunit delta'
MSLAELFPWLETAWSQVHGMPGRLPHSILISGPAGVGKSQFAQTLAQGLLCRSPSDSGKPCGQCKSCRLYLAGNHPDLKIASPAEDSSIIGIDQVRAVIEYFSLRPHTSARKIAILHPAEAMNLNASNALLKVLEEPPADAVLLIVSSTPQKLSATIRSRCTQIRIPSPKTTEAIRWLQSRKIDVDLASDLLASANGAPLLALSLHENGFAQARQLMLDDLTVLASGQGDPVACAQRWKQIGAAFSLSWFSGLIADLIQLRSAGRQQARLNNPSQGEKLNTLASAASLVGLFSLFERTVESANLSETPLDDSLLIEDILIGWCKTSI